MKNYVIIVTMVLLASCTKDEHVPVPQAQQQTTTVPGQPYVGHELMGSWILNNQTNYTSTGTISLHMNSGLNSNIVFYPSGEYERIGGPRVPLTIDGNYFYVTYPSTTVEYEYEIDGDSLRTTTGGPSNRFDQVYSKN